MYTESILFDPDMPVTYDAFKVSHYHLHCHEGVIEVLILLSGSAHVKVSFEEFDMKEGDYIVINTEDSHSIYATDSKCEAASLFFNMSSYKEHIPYLDYVLFALESFDLVKYKNETQRIRRMIAGVLLNLARHHASPRDRAFCESLKHAAEELLWTFVNDYDMRNYYNRNWNAGYHKTERYYRIMKYINENYEMKNLMDYIAKNEFYSKSYITHLFKQIGASSYQDVLTYIRLYKSERLLLDSDVPIIEIADRCGFSDIKYYTSNFKKWFLYTPSEYRKIFQPEVAKNSVFQRLRTEDLIARMENLIRSNADDTPYKAAVNPLSIKAKDSWAPLFEKNGSELPSYVSANATAEPDNARVSHQICIRIDDKIDLRELVSQFQSLQEKGFIPALIIHYGDLSPAQCSSLLARCSYLLTETEPLGSDIEIMIAYSSFHDRAIIDKLVKKCEKNQRIKLRPMLMAE